MDSVVAHSQEIIGRADALARGLKRYFTGKPCKHGHVAERRLPSNNCTECARQTAPVYHKRYRSTPEFKARHAAEVRVAYRAKHPNWKPIVRLSEEEKRERRRLARRAYYAKRKVHLLALNRQTRANRRKAEGRHTAADIAALLDKQRNKCGICFRKLSSKYHVDHVRPLAKGGSNWPFNLQILCQPCNNRKSDKDPISFAQELGRLL